MHIENQEFTFVCIQQMNLPEIVCFQAQIYFAGGIFIPGAFRKNAIEYQSDHIYGAIARDGGESGATAQLSAIFDFLWNRDFQIQNMICHEPRPFLTEAQCAALLADYLNKKRS